MKTRILVVDDDLAVAPALAASLAGEAHVVQVPRAEEALRLCQEEPFDLILVDWSLPGLDGAEFVRAVRALHPQTRIVAVTAPGDREQPMAAVRAGASGHLDRSFYLRILGRRGGGQDPNRCEDPP